MTIPILSLLIWLPILGGLGILTLKKYAPRSRILFLASALSGVCLGLSLFLLKEMQWSEYGMQFQEHQAWIPHFNLFYSLGVDGFSAPLIGLSCFISFLVILLSADSVRHRVQEYLAALLMLQGLICGVFSSLDALLFYVYWEALLIPMFFIIGIWGGENRKYATLKFFLYTFLGSVLLLAVILYLHQKVASLPEITENARFSLLTFQNLALPLSIQKYIFVGLLIAFAVKVPMWPIHTWLPDAHSEAPTGGSVLLAAILLKMGGYGFIRLALPITPHASQFFAPGMVVLALIAIVYIAWVALVQTDFKKLIAYSSISHMGMVMLGLFIPLMLIQKGDVSGAVMSVQGAMIEMISHGLVSAALFFSVGALYDRVHTRSLEAYGGVARVMPRLASLFMLFSLANLALPGTSGFVGELLILLSAFKANPLYAILAATILILGAAYTLRLYKAIMFGPLQDSALQKVQDIQGLEKGVLGILAVCILGLGLYPDPVMKGLKAPSEHLIQQLMKPQS